MGGRVKGVCHGNFLDIVSLENLFLAWQEFRRGKLRRSDVQNFEFRLEDNLFLLHEELKSKNYQHSKYTPFYVTDPKLRHIHKANVRDRVLHHALFRILYSLFDRSFIFDSYSCRDSKGTHRAVLRLETFIKRASQNFSKNIYALKCDISKYFDSIDQAVLMHLIRAKIKDPDTLWLIEGIINSFEKQSGKGIPLGNVTSQLFANIYLNELDQFMKQKLKVRYYLRYCDDFIMVHENKNYLEQLVPFIQLFLTERLQLTLHPRKVTLGKLSAGVDFLGYVILPHYRVVRARTRKRMTQKIKAKIVDFRKGLLTKTALDQSVHSYFGMLKHCKGNRIKELIQELIK